MKHLFYLLIFLVTTQVSFAKKTKTLFFGTATKTLEIPFGEKTILVFEKRVRSYSKSSNYRIKPENESNPNYTTLTVSPNFTKGSEKVAFALEDGKTARLRFKTIKNLSNGFMELTYKIKSKTYTDVSKPAPIGEIELLKAMIRDDEVAGYKRKVLSKSIPSKKPGVISKLVRVYKGEGLHGYVFSLESHRYRTKVRIDVRKVKLGYPNLAVLSQIDDKILYPRGMGVSETLLRIVAKSDARYRSVLIPTTIQGFKEDE